MNFSDIFYHFSTEQVEYLNHQSTREKNDPASWIIRSLILALMLNRSLILKSAYLMLKEDYSSKYKVIMKYDLKHSTIYQRVKCN